MLLKYLVLYNILIKLHDSHITNKYSFLNKYLVSIDWNGHKDSVFIRFIVVKSAGLIELSYYYRLFCNNKPRRGDTRS